MVKDSRELAWLAVEAADDKKAIDILALDIRGISLLADYFVICSGSSELQVKAICDSITKKMKDRGIIPKNIEGYQEARWILLDLENVVVHIFHRETRDYYQLERLWADAPEVQDSILTGEAGR
ncbi:MAG: ribosome silencing factor [Halanaerobium sp.]|nr:ribosome silencing factor [Halanaerobium sp.]